MEYRIDEIDNGEHAIRELAVLEEEKRASFSFIAENTAKIIQDALLKIEYFEANHQFVMNAIDIWASWTEHYRVFHTTYKEGLKNTCEEEGIEDEIWSQWFSDWKAIRFKIEQKIQPMIERGLKGTVPVEIRLYKCTLQFQTALQEIIFNRTKTEDRVFILNWAGSLLDIQIDEIMSLVADHDLQKISKTILDEFAQLKQKNYETYLTDAKVYGEEKARREKQYNSLVFKMRKDLMK